MTDRSTYCMNCDRSIYGKYKDCDVNIENDGKYVMSDSKGLLFTVAPFSWYNSSK